MTDRIYIVAPTLYGEALPDLARGSVYRRHERATAEQWLSDMTDDEFDAEYPAIWRLYEVRPVETGGPSWLSDGSAHGVARRRAMDLITRPTRTGR